MFYRDELTPEPSITLTRAMMESARIPRAYWNCELANIPDSLAHAKPLKDYVANIGQRDRDGRGLYLFGIYGTGKTGAGVAILKEAMRRGGRAVFFSALELEPVFGKHTDPGLREAVLKTHFLVLDDLGAEKGISWSPQWVETVIKLRNNEKLPTIITTNEKPIELFSRIKSIASILGGGYDAVHVFGHDWRMDGPPPQPAK